ncbi:MAG: class I SAM-dependent rRNA methyltransferase, partial [Acidobacteriota bacterium]|nr:class I SAM-dependent rRNA methyltransferase [Acidobacteriota bacterium]
MISPRGVERIRAGHLWIYRSDLREAQGQPGAIVRVVDERGRCHGWAFYSDKSQISIRLLTREDAPIGREFFAARLRHAAEYRRRVVENSDSFRLVYSEADLLPSIIIDRYGDYLVVQTLSQGAERLKGLLVDLLVDLFAPKGILERNDPRVRLLEGLEQQIGVLHGEVPSELLVKENGVSFLCDLAKGQKTGSFLDQRENHFAARRYASGNVLDCFSYHGGFALTIADRCERVESVEMAPAAIEIARRNQEINSITNV